MARERVGLSALGMAIGLMFWIQAAGCLSRWLVALGGVAVGGILYLSGVVILKVPEVNQVMSAVQRRLKTEMLTVKNGRFVVLGQ